MSIHAIVFKAQNSLDGSRNVISVVGRRNPSSMKLTDLFGHELEYVNRVTGPRLGAELLEVGER